MTEQARALANLRRSITTATEKLCPDCEWDPPAKLEGTWMHVEGQEVDECEAANLWSALERVEAAFKAPSESRCIYWVAGGYENGMDDLDELVRQQMDDRGERSGIIEIVPARYEPRFWVSVNPDPNDPDGDVFTRHATLAEAEAAQTTPTPEAAS